MASGTELVEIGYSEEEGVGRSKRGCRAGDLDGVISGSERVMIGVLSEGDMGRPGRGWRVEDRVGAVGGTEWSKIEVASGGGVEDRPLGEIGAGRTSAVFTVGVLKATSACAMPTP